MDTRRSARFIATMWKYALAAVVGFLITVLTLAVSREVYFAFQARPAAEIIGSWLSAIGSLRWVDTTLITGLAAVAAAYLSVSAVRQQIDQTAKIERARIAARRAGVKANLGIALSAICDYATECAQLNHFLLSKCGVSRLPREIDIPAFPTIPDGAVATITAMVEFAEPENREAIARIGPSIKFVRLESEE